MHSVYCEHTTSLRHKPQSSFCLSLEQPSSLRFSQEPPSSVSHCLEKMCFLSPDLESRPDPTLAHNRNPVYVRLCPSVSLVAAELAQSGLEAPSSVKPLNYGAATASDHLEMYYTPQPAADELP